MDVNEVKEKSVCVLILVGSGARVQCTELKTNSDAVFQSIDSGELKHAGLVLWHFIGVYFIM